MVKDWCVPLSQFEDNLGSDGKRFWIGLRHGTMYIELFAPRGTDVQQPHLQDELYIILRGSGRFSKGGELRTVRAGDVIFVEAGVAHRFENFTDDFATWAIFWGPEGGEDDHSGIDSSEPDILNR